jgi:hypothetical protein
MERRRLEIRVSIVDALPPPNACVRDRRQRETVSTIKTRVEAASCSLDAMVGHSSFSGS